MTMIVGVMCEIFIFLKQFIDTTMSDCDSSRIEHCRFARKVLGSILNPTLEREFLTTMTASKGFGQRFHNYN